MRIFAERDLSAFLEQRRQQLKDEVQSAEKNYLLNVNRTTYVSYLVDRYRIDPLVLDRENARVSDKEVLIPAEHFPGDFHVLPGKKYPKQVITYHVPYSGEEALLRCTPSSIIGWSADIRLERGCVCHDIVNWRNNSEEITRAADDFLRHLSQRVDEISKKIVQYNDQLPAYAEKTFDERRDVLLKQSNLLASLGVPIKKEQHVPQTFSVPVVRKRIVVKPTAPTTAFAPEPALDNQIYSDILRIIEDTGREMERHPSIYEGKNEEDLRDFFIMVLSPHFQSVTGETFNKSGKTDILIRHEAQNVFVAECKFWAGIKEFHEAINQLLKYLTWRDSKSALICFVKNKELGPVLQQIESRTSDHYCFVKYRGKMNEGSFNFEFHLKDDPTRPVRLAVICFHLV